VFPCVQDAYADRQREAPQTPALELTVVGPPMSSPTYTGTLGQVRKEVLFVLNDRGCMWRLLGQGTSLRSFHLAADTLGHRNAHGSR